MFTLGYIDSKLIILILCTICTCLHYLFNTYFFNLIKYYYKMNNLECSIYNEIVNSLRKHPYGGLMILAQGLKPSNVTALLLSNFLEKRGNLIFLLNYSP